MKRIFSAGRGLAFIVFMTVFLFTGCGQSAEPKSEVKNPTLHDAAVKMVAGRYEFRRKNRTNAADRY